MWTRMTHIVTWWSVAWSDPRRRDLFGNRNFFARASKLVGGLKGADNGEEPFPYHLTLTSNLKTSPLTLNCKA